MMVAISGRLGGLRPVELNARQLRRLIAKINKKIKNDRHLEREIKRITSGKGSREQLLPAFLETRAQIDKQQLCRVFNKMKSK